MGSEKGPRAPVKGRAQERPRALCQIQQTAAAQAWANSRSRALLFLSLHGCTPFVKYTSGGEVRCVAVLATPSHILREAFLFFLLFLLHAPWRGSISRVAKSSGQRKEEVRAKQVREPASPNIVPHTHAQTQMWYPPASPHVLCVGSGWTGLERNSEPASAGPEA